MAEIREPLPEERSVIVPPPVWWSATLPVWGIFIVLLVGLLWGWNLTA
jgi:hypothetical protein